MPVSESRRNEYSEQFHFRLKNDEAKKLKAIISKEKITLVDFIRRAINENEKPSE